MEKIKAGQDLSCRLIFWLILKYKDIKMNLNFMMFIQELIEKTMGQM